MTDLRNNAAKFYCLGLTESGDYLAFPGVKQHPEIFMPAKKELNFFFHNAEYAKGQNYYQSYFNTAPASAIAIGEASPGYICHPETPKRIQRLLPNAKLIVTVREPIARAYSQYWDNRRSLSESINLLRSNRNRPGRDLPTGKIRLLQPWDVHSVY